MPRIQPRLAPGRAPRIALAVLALAVALGATPQTGEPRATEEPEAPEPLETELVGIRGAIINASVKLKNGIVGIAEQDADLPPTPARECCAANVRRIESRIVAAARLLDAFDRCYESEGNPDMVLTSRVAKNDLLAFANALQQFVNAPKREQTQAGLDGMTRTYNLLRDTAVKLEPCGRLESPVEPAPAAERDVSDPEG